MIPESQADKLLAPIYTTYTDVETTILAHAGDIQLTLFAPRRARKPPKSASTNSLKSLEEALDDWLYSSEGESLEQIVLYYLGLRQATLAVAESCTGGMVAERITGVPGSSRSFLGGAVVYSDPLKTSFRQCPAGAASQSMALYRPRWRRRSLKAFASAPARRLAWESPASPVPLAARTKSP